MDLVFAYLAGLLTMINPCIVPVLPIAVASAFSAGRLGPLALVAGMVVTFTAFGLATASLGPALGITPERVAQFSALAMVLFGMVLLVPRASASFAFATAGIADRANAGMNEIHQGGMRGQFLGGMLLGAVWSPCIGPTLGGAIALASQGADLAWAGAIMLAFSLGVASIFLGLAYAARETLRLRAGILQSAAKWSKPIMGVVFVAVGLALFFGLHHFVEAALLDAMPIWLQDLSVSL
ncbi:MAG: cytochrome c biogenesis CcdA family protein [Rhizobiaceae bacterium]